MRRVRVISAATVVLEVSVPDWQHVDEMLLANEISANFEADARKSARQQGATLRDVSCSVVVAADR